jgi:hypothetical protein
MSSQAESISAWYTDLDWPSIVAALIVARHEPASSSAARRKIAARSSNDSSRQPGAARLAASMAADTSSSVASPSLPSRCAWLCGCTTSIQSPPPIRWTPPTVIVRSTGSFARSLSLVSSAVRSELPGA